MEIIKNIKIKKLTIKNINSTKCTVYIAIKSAGRRYTISLLVRSAYNANLDFRSFCSTVAGCQTHFHWGPYQHYVCPQRASCNC